jgi:hypothetical protein
MAKQAERPATNATHDIEKKSLKISAKIGVGSLPLVLKKNAKSLKK